MFSKCLFLLLLSSFYGAFAYRSSSSLRCPLPRDSNLSIRVMQRGKLAKFTCRGGFTLIGNKYTTCRNGVWDEQPPICISSGCNPLEEVPNSVNQTYHDGAWVLFFCMPKHNLVGSSVVYCNGRNWNTTAPKCVDSTAKSKTSCDFEENFCGWKQDELHDFDWRRINTKTPSSFAKTGPSSDHTLGVNGNGYFLYIESTSRSENDTARLLSPVYDESLIKDGCFAFYYHMYGKHIGGLRVYQKPDKVDLLDVLRSNIDGKNKYLLFEVWGDNGDVWYTGVMDLLDVSDDFQIVIEGIRGTGFISDIAIDDVAILKGENCTNLKLYAITPSPQLPEYSDSCVSRCGESGNERGCSCDSYICDSVLRLEEGTCCPDYLDICVFGNSVSSDLPQTQKLIGTPTTAYKTETSIAPSARTFSTTSTTPQPTSTKQSSTSTARSSTTTRRSSTTPRRVSTNTRQIPTTTRRVPTATQSTTTTQRTSTIRQTTVTKSISTSRSVPTTTSRISTRRTTSKVSTPRWTTRSTTRFVKPSTRRLTTTTATPVPSTTLVPTTITSKTQATTILPKSSTRRLPFTATLEEVISSSIKLKESKSQGPNGIVTAVIVVLMLGLSGGLIYGVYFLRTSRGSAALARLRGRATSDPEVRFLKSDVDDIDIDDE